MLEFKHVPRIKDHQIDQSGVSEFGVFAKIWPAEVEPEKKVAAREPHKYSHNFMMR